MINKITIEIIKDYESKPIVLINNIPIDRKSTTDLILFLKTIPTPIGEHSFIDSIYDYIKEIWKK